MPRRTAIDDPGRYLGRSYDDWIGRSYLAELAGPDENLEQLKGHLRQMIAVIR